MKTRSVVLAFMMALLLTAGVAEAAKKAKSLNGTISAINGTSLTITPRAPKGSSETPTDVIVETNDQTRVTIKGEEKTVADLKVGEKVRVRLAADGKTATAISTGNARKGKTK